MNIMDTLRSHPPVTQQEIMGYTQDPEGRIIGISVLLRDANGLMFSLHVATDENYLSVASDDPNSNDNNLEPVFIVPLNSIDEELLTGIVNGIRPDLLDMYLVAQDNSVA